MMDWSLAQADAEHLPLRDKTIQCVITSPPYWGLRDYGVAGAIGLESTLDQYIDRLVAVFREIRRVLRDDGTLWLNVGDSYNSSRTCGTYGDQSTKGYEPHGRECAQVINLDSKQLIGQPWRIAFALQADGWILRSDIIWHKPNPMPESATDRPTNSHEHVFLLTKQSRYYYDAEAVRTKLSKPSTAQGHSGDWAKVDDGRTKSAHHRTPPSRMPGYIGPPGGANLRNVWTIPTEGFPGVYCCACKTFYADDGRKLREHMDHEGKRHRICRCGVWDRWLSHFATFPRKLIEPCIKAGTSDKGCCPECGMPWLRVVDKERRPTRPGEKTKCCGRNSRVYQDRDPAHPEERKLREGNRDPGRHVTESRTIGWEPGCGCVSDDTTSPLSEPDAGRPIPFDPVPCMVLDPFCGSGTVGVVARQLGRRFIGIELNPAYCEMARRRIENPDPGVPIPDVPDQTVMPFA